MTTGATGRHRAALRPSTPLSSLSVAVGDQVGSLGRGGVVIAMSSGLVATMGLLGPASSIIEGITTIGFFGVFVFLACMGVALLRRGRGAAPASA